MKKRYLIHFIIGALLWGIAALYCSFSFNRCTQNIPLQWGKEARISSITAQSGNAALVSYPIRVPAPALANSKWNSSRHGVNHKIIDHSFVCFSNYKFRIFSSGIPGTTGRVSSLLKLHLELCVFRI